MLTFMIDPLVGVGPVKFGQTRGEVRAALALLGQSEASPRDTNTDTFFDAAFQIHYDADGSAEFIECAASPSFRVVFQGESLLELLAEDAVRFVSRYAAYDTDDPEPGGSYIFPALQLSLWRSIVPEGPKDIEGRRFDAVSAGKADYYPNPR